MDFFPDQRERCWVGFAWNSWTAEISRLHKSRRKLSRPSKQILVQAEHRTSPRYTKQFLRPSLMPEKPQHDPRLYLSTLLSRGDCRRIPNLNF
ncbi:hypothetical protein BGHDH14_bgh00845 [Blumeria hordei DH14]|uniref:Uncharacterized protein n=1 Tax=Blumeria graminis f. sp. hordei (strain DH14) TaxID=546991 RepID=N1J4Y9_BLUG1|nr:hypothetical protein BGHDH14_bgh00845 [Blumeria hordei DH14]